MANLFPGSKTPAEFWDNLLSAKDLRAGVTGARLGVDPQYYLGKKGEVDRYYCLQGGYVTDYHFDPTGFLADAAYLQGLDDVFQFTLGVAREALRDGGYWSSPALERCGIILGNLSFPTKSSNHLFVPFYHQAVEDALRSHWGDGFRLNHFTDYKDVHPDNALIAGLPSALVAQATGLGGAHFSLDAACASSCYALKLACDYLATGKADLMLAGAVSAADPLFVQMGFSIFQAYPGNSVSAPLDSRSGGLFAGEGAGMMLLKRYSDALRDGDKIQAVIRGGGLSNDGKGEFVLSPNTKGQVLAFERAYAAAGVVPSEVAYVECHATGTPKGDRVELTSLETFFGPTGHRPLLGSVKANLGHLLTAAGMPGLMKVVLSLNKAQIPATPHVVTPMHSPTGYFGGGQIPVHTTAWPATHPTRLAGVSVFGFGGANAHVIVQEPSSVKLRPTKPLAPAQPLAIIGMDAHFGAAADLTSFARLVNEGQNVFRDLPAWRWKGLETNSQVMAALGLERAPRAAYVEAFEVDVMRFKVPPTDRDALIAQQLLLMKVADKAAKDAGLKEGSNVAVLVAMGIELELHQYRGRVNLDAQLDRSFDEAGTGLGLEERQAAKSAAKDSMAPAAELNQYTSFIGNIMASRISALWDFTGPSLTISDEENSVFRCLELADNLLRTSDVDAVIVAAVDLAGSFENLVLRRHYGSGWTAGDGAGALVVRPVSRTLPGTAYATLEGLGFASGRDEAALDQAISAAWALARVSPGQILEVETSSSGFGEEDQAEAATLLQRYPGAKLSSVKSMVGHTFSAAGMPALLRTILDLGAGKGNSGRLAAVNSFGRGGAGHAILRGVDSPRPVKPLPPGKIGLLKTFVLGGAPIEAGIAQRITQLSSSVWRRVSRPLRLNKIPLSPSKRTPMSEPPPSLSLPDTLRAHQAFLNLRQSAQAKIAQLLELQLAQPGVSDSLVHLPSPPVQGIAPSVRVSSPPLRAMAPPSPAPRLSDPPVLKEAFTQPKKVIFTTEDLVEFAEGKIANVFGPEYAVIDTYPRRVRLPTTDYLLVTRVTDLEAKVNEYKKSYMATEYDIPVDAPYLIEGQIPWSVAVESGQCDLMLISYIGIDFLSKGVRVYRLLDCQLTFLEDMALGGQTLRYEIHIDSYAKNGDQLLFFFHYDCYVGGKKVLIMRGGCAGFFTDKELADGKGVIHNDKDKAELAGAVKSSFVPLIANSRTEFDGNSILKLLSGDLVGCFGPSYDQGTRNPSLKFSSRKFLMIERVTKVDSKAGHWGLGVLEGQKQLEPNHWYFPCHFKDDHVMAGSLMSEGCGQLAMFYMLWLGMHTKSQNARFQPIPGECQTVRCRGQVTQQSNVLTYRMEVTALGMEPYPYLKANIDIILDGRVVVDFKNLSLMIKETQTPEPPLMRIETDTESPKIKGVSPIRHFEAPFVAGQNRVPNQVPFTPWHLFEFATGDISKCFGPAFDVYRNRIPPRTPCGDLQLVTQVVDVQGTPMNWKQASSCRAEYQVPREAWYFKKNSHPGWMPYSIIMEIALQPNGFLSGYMGTTLAYPEKDLFFRNLDGTGVLHRQLDLRGKTIVNESVLESTSMAGGAIIQSFRFRLSVDTEMFFEGKAVFGYFSGESLINQLGIDNGKKSDPWFTQQNTPKSDLRTFDLTGKHPFFEATPERPHYRLAGRQMHFVDQVTIVEGGGKAGKGYVFGERTIDATDWFFRYHFHQDPVMPGSLGVEAILELLQVYALANDLGAGFRNPRFIAPLTTVVWKYRGQITPENRTMTLDLHLTDVIREPGRVVLVADASLSKDRLRIYEVKNLVLAIEEA